MKSFSDYWDIVYEPKVLEENDASRSYACLMLDCSDFKPELQKIQSQIRPEDIYTKEEGHGLETDPHITVLYGIHDQDVNSVKDQLGDLSPCDYQLSGLSLFENTKFDVLKCSVKSVDLRAMNKRCTDNLEYTNDYPSYVPHLTVAYLLPGTGKKYTSIKSDKFKTDLSSGTYIFSTKDSKKTKWTVTNGG